MYKKELRSALDQLERLDYGDGSINSLVEEAKKTLEKENDPHVLFGMLQCLREVIASETGDKAKFKFMTPDGKIHEVSSKEEADKIGREYGRGDTGDRTKQG